MGRPESSSGRSLSDILAHAEGTHNTVVIAAIPAEDDYVWKISSEKVPHLTLLYLGEMEMGPKIAQIAEFLEHAASTSLNRFGLDVDRRGELGDDKADVLFFSKGWSTKHVEEFRSYLLNNQAIYEAYSSTTQFPKWTPHLTLGYPETPAKPVERDFGINWVNFDRIALWVGDYEGPEFRLKNDYDMEVAMSSDTVERGRRAAEGLLSHKATKKSPENVQLSESAKKKLDAMMSKYGKEFFTTPLMAYVKELPESKRLKTMRSITSDVKQLNALLDKSTEAVAVHGLRDWVESKVSRDNLGQFTSKASGAANEKMDSLSDFGDWIDKNIYGVNADGTPIDPNGLPLFDPVMSKITEGGDWVDKNVYGVKPDGSPIDPDGARLFQPVVSVFSMIPSAAKQAYSYVSDKLKHSDDRMTVVEALAHYGVKGMKWGIRRTPAQLAAASKDSEEAQRIAKIAKTSGTKALSNDELRELNTRLQLEQQYMKLQPQNKGRIKKGQEFTNEVLGVGRTVNDAIAFANSPAGKGIRAALATGGGKHVKR